MKPYSALDRTTSALPHNMNYQHMTGRNNLPENSISRVPTQTMTSSSSLSNPNQQSYPAQRSNLPNSNYPNSSNPSVHPQALSNQQRYPTNPAQQNTQNMGYQQQRQTSMPAMGMPQHQQQPPMQQQQNPNPNSLQPQNGRAYPNQSTTNVGMGPTTTPIQQMSNPSFDGKTDAISRQQARVDSYPNNIPMMALQQQKV